MKKLVSGYLADWGVKNLVPEDAKKLDILNYAFAVIKDGKVSDEPYYNISKVQDFRQNNPRLKVCLCIGGWAADGFSQAASTAEGRRKFAESAVDLVKKLGFNGIDIDWEYPGSSTSGIVSSPNDKENFTLLLKEVRKSLSNLTRKTGEDYLLTIAVGAFQGAADNIEVSEVSKILDYVNIMTYDFAQGTELTKQKYHTNLLSESGIASTSVDSAVAIYEKAGLPREQMLIGAAFYGYYIQNADIINNKVVLTSNNPKNGSFTYTEIASNRTENQGYKYYWDDVAKASWRWSGFTYITYDSPQSIRAKCRYVKDKNLAGIMFWEYSQDKTGSLLNTMYEQMNEGDRSSKQYMNYNDSTDLSDDNDDTDYIEESNVDGLYRHSKDNKHHKEDEHHKDKKHDNEDKHHKDKKHHKEDKHHKDKKHHKEDKHHKDKKHHKEDKHHKDKKHHKTDKHHKGSKHHKD